METYSEQHRELLEVLGIPVNKDGQIDINAENVFLDIDENGRATYTITAGKDNN